MTLADLLQGRITPVAMGGVAPPGRNRPRHWLDPMEGDDTQGDSAWARGLEPFRRSQRDRDMPLPPEPPFPYDMQLMPGPMFDPSEHNVWPWLPQHRRPHGL